MTDEIRPTNIEKIYLKSGETFFLYNPKYSHMIDRRVYAGRAIDLKTFRPENTQIVIDPADIDHTVGAGYNAAGELVEDPSVLPPSCR